LAFVGRLKKSRMASKRHTKLFTPALKLSHFNNFVCSLPFKICSLTISFEVCSWMFLKLEVCLDVWCKVGYFRILFEL
jgi:hypothetical protein